MNAAALSQIRSWWDAITVGRGGGRNNFAHVYESPPGSRDRVKNLSRRSLRAIAGPPQQRGIPPATTAKEEDSIKLAAILMFFTFSILDCIDEATSRDVLKDFESDFFEPVIGASVQQFDDQFGAEKKIVSNWNAWKDLFGRPSVPQAFEKFRQLVRRNPRDLDAQLLEKLSAMERQPISDAELQRALQRPSNHDDAKPFMRFSNSEILFSLRSISPTYKY